MLTTGPPLTVIVIDALAVLWPLSATAAVRTCGAELRVFLGIVPPVPSAPWRSEAQAFGLDTSPSWGSLAAAVNEIVSAWLKRAPLNGVVIVTAGRPETVTEREADAVRPPLSVTVAVRVWTPAV